MLITFPISPANIEKTRYMTNSVLQGIVPFSSLIQKVILMCMFFLQWNLSIMKTLNIFLVYMYMYQVSRFISG